MLRSLHPKIALETRKGFTVCRTCSGEMERSWYYHAYPVSPQ